MQNIYSVGTGRSCECYGVLWIKFRRNTLPVWLVYLFIKFIVILNIVNTLNIGHIHSFTTDDSLGVSS